MEPTILIGLLLIILGLANLYRPFIEWFIKFRSETRGVRTEIKETTIMWYKFGGVIAIIAGITILITTIFIR